MEWYLILLTIGIGFFAGFINTIAGGGSLLTLPLLMFLGLPANIANGTNRIAIIMQNIVATRNFKKGNVLNFRQGLYLAVPAMIGSVLGASLAVDLSEQIMKRTIGILLVVMFFVILYKPDKWLKAQTGIIKEKPGLLQILLFFGLGFYGGFIQAGIGFFLLAALVLISGLDLVRANAIKLLIILLFNLPAIAIFIWQEQVEFLTGFILAGGNMAGGFVGSKVAMKWNPNFIRWVLLVTLLVSAVKLLGIYDFFKSII